MQSGGAFNVKIFFAGPLWNIKIIGDVLRGAVASSNYLATSIHNNNQHTFFVDGAEALFGLNSSFAVDTTS